MQVVEFKVSLVASRDGVFVIAFFDGAEVPACVALLQCEREAAGALMKALGSALDTGETR